MAEFVEVVAATIEMPMSHHGIEFAPLKYSAPPPERLRNAAIAGMARSTRKNSAISAMSSQPNVISVLLCLL